MKIGVDLDGVLADFLTEFYEIINGLWPGRVPEGYVAKNWYHTDILSDDEIAKAFDVIHQTENFWLTLDTFSDNAQALYTFLRDHPEVEVYYITARDPAAGMSLLAQCFEWLSSRGMMWEHTSIMPTKSGKVKGDIIRALNIDFSIDDSADTVRYTVANAHKGHRAYLLTRPWNSGELLSPDADFKRVDSVRQFLTLVEEAMNGQAKDEQ